MEKFKKGAIITMVIAGVFATLFIILSVVMINKYQGVELPEELMSVTADSSHAEPFTVYPWRDGYGKLRIDLRYYKH